MEEEKWEPGSAVQKTIAGHTISRIMKVLDHDDTREVLKAESKESQLIIKRLKLSKKSKEARKDYEQFRKECELTVNMSIVTDHVPRLLTQEFQENTSSYSGEVVLSYTGENLLEHFSKKKDPKDLRICALQTADVMYLAEIEGIYHSDLSPSNMTFDNNDAYIIDFGVSQHLGSSTKLRMTTQHPHTLGLKLPYAPPELLMPGPEFNRNKIDVYAWGMSFLCLLCYETERVYMDAISKLGLFRNELGLYEQFWNSLPKLTSEWIDFVPFIGLLKRATHPNAKLRPDFSEIVVELAHIFRLSGRETCPQCTNPTSWRLKLSCRHFVCKGCADVSFKYALRHQQPPNIIMCLQCNAAKHVRKSFPRLHPRVDPVIMRLHDPRRE
jgi:serine/threonine protein kinase